MSVSEKTPPGCGTESPACPDCGAATLPGGFTVDQSLPATVVNGPNWVEPDLFFTARGDSRFRRQPVMELDDRSAWLCPKCGFILIRGAVASKVESDLRDWTKMKKGPGSPAKIPGVADRAVRALDWWGLLR